MIILGITSPPYRRTLCEWFQLLFPHLPQCCQRTIRERSKSIRLQNNILLEMNHNKNKMKTLDEHNSPNMILNDRNLEPESASLVPR
jgi:hypothetical protein